MAFVDCVYLDALYWTLADEYVDLLDEETFAETINDRAAAISGIAYD